MRRLHLKRGGGEACWSPKPEAKTGVQKIGGGGGGGGGCANTTLEGGKEGAERRGRGVKGGGGGRRGGKEGGGKRGGGKEGGKLVRVAWAVGGTNASDLQAGGQRK